MMSSLRVQMPRTAFHSVRDTTHLADARTGAATQVNAEDAAIWRWFAALLDDRRIRWRFVFNHWVVHVDRKRVSTAATFYDAIRLAKERSEGLGVGAL
jgi:hypothetical protein